MDIILTKTQNYSFPAIPNVKHAQQKKKAQANRIAIHAFKDSNFIKNQKIA
jgi:hypothetical protein